jgi:lauroyl/myristoyl acyltransferase
VTTLNDIEQLSFLGMRLALRNTIGELELRSYAKGCARRRNDNLRYWIEHQELPRVAITGIEHLQQGHEANKGVVVTSFQMGPYNWIPLILNRKAALQTTLLMDAANFREEGRRWDARESTYSDHLIDPVKYINSEDPTAIWKMASALRTRRTLVGWFDGLTGTTASESSKSDVIVKFCETQMRVRMGLAFISAKTGAPLILAVTKNDRQDGITLRFEPPLTRSVDESIERFCQRASQSFVSILEQEIRMDPPCWEEWCHFNLRNLFQPRRPSLTSPDDDTLLSAIWHIDMDNIDLLQMSDCDVFVSLRSGAGLALTELIKALRQLLAKGMSVRDLTAALGDEFAAEDIKAALRTLYEDHFIYPSFDLSTDINSDSGAPVGVDKPQEAKQCR